MHEMLVQRPFPPDCKQFPSATEIAAVWLSNECYETPDICQKDVSSSYGLVPGEHAFPQPYLGSLGSSNLPRLLRFTKSKLAHAPVTTPNVVDELSRPV